MIREAIKDLVGGNSLGFTQASNIMREIMEGGSTPSQLAAFLTALHIKGETPEEIAGMASVMREKSLKVSVPGVLVDTAGTGGDMKNTINISTGSAIIAAGAGLKVAKHGNRAATGSCGSADVLEELGINIELSPTGVRECIKRTGFGFMFAPIFHPAMKYAGPTRKEIGIRTVFNILGPLTNPANAQCQLLGVSDITIGPKIAEVLRLLGTKHSIVVHGNDGLDELTLSGNTHMWEIKDNKVISYTVCPSDFGLDTIATDALSGGSKSDNAAKLWQVLEGKTGPLRDVMLLNSAAVILLGGKTPSLERGLFLAKDSIDSGRALACLKHLVSLSKQLA